MLIHWLLILFLNGSETGVVSGEPYKTREDCDTEGEIRVAMAQLKQSGIESVRYLCVIQQKKAGA